MAPAISNLLDYMADEREREGFYTEAATLRRAAIELRKVGK